MRIGILGQPCIDEIIAPDGSLRNRSLGGILYSYAAMERLMSGAANDSFVALTWLSESDRPLLLPLLDRMSHLTRSAGLWPTESLTNRVQLVYHNTSERTEHCPNVLPAITPRELSAELLSSLDGLFVNMISGYDVALDTLEALLLSVTNRPYVHLDVHALVLGDLSRSSSQESRYGGGRSPRGVADWRRWLALADSVQLNELETQWIAAPEITSEDAFLTELRRERPGRLRWIIITRAARGATLFDLEHNTRHDYVAPPAEVLEPTGSGDVFGSAFTYSILQGDPPRASLENAVTWATWNTTLPSIEDILRGYQMNTCPKAASGSGSGSVKACSIPALISLSACSRI